MDCNVLSYGAVPNGGGICTGQIQNAIDYCHNTGGGKVIFPKGVFVSGTLYMKSNVTLWVEPCAVLKASGNISDYAADTHYNRYINEPHLDRCFIYGQGQVHIGFGGGGEINGNAPAFHNEEDWYAPRPMLLRLLNCKDIKLEHIHLKDAASWTTAFLDCTNITAVHLNIAANVNLNGDGLDFDGCRSVRVTDCVIQGSDDNICLQADKKDSVTEDVVIENCTLSSVCGNIRIGMKSVGIIRNVKIANCTFSQTWREGIKIECSEGGTIEKICIENTFMRNVRRPFYFICNNTIASIGVTQMPAIGKIADISIQNIEIVDEEQEMDKEHFYLFNGKKCIMGTPLFSGIRIDAEEKHKICRLDIRNLSYTALGGIDKSDIPVQYPKVVDARFENAEKTVSNYYPDWSRATFADIRNVEGLRLEHWNLQSIRPDTRPGLIIENCEQSKCLDICEQKER